MRSIACAVLVDNSDNSEVKLTQKKPDQTGFNRKKLIDTASKKHTQTDSYR